MSIKEVETDKFYWNEKGQNLMFTWDRNIPLFSIAIVWAKRVNGKVFLFWSCWKLFFVSTLVELLIKVVAAISKFGILYREKGRERAITVVNTEIDLLHQLNL